ncbi:type II toxin-antitoxin system RelE/ParE family toxin [Endothiovibrio diazotrophicus]
MSRRVTFHESAEVELNEAADFYDLESPGLGTLFIEEIERTLGTLTEFPEAAPQIRGRVRAKSMAKFPYSLMYSVRPGEIRVLAVAHQKRRPYYWRDRR